MAECNISLSYANLKPEDKICKYSYTSWCPTCERDSPRRRTKSETFEPCKRKVREMKTFTPKKYDRRHEYENLETDYDFKDIRLDRIRSNLCELPTTYITNNCQIKTPKLSTNQTDFYDYNKLQVDYENSYRLEEFSCPVFNNMTEKVGCNSFDDISIKVDHIKRQYNQNSLSKTMLEPRITPKPCCKKQIPLIQNGYPVCKKSDKIDSSNYSFETCNFFDKHIDPVEVKERYSKEIEILKEKLKDLSNHKYSPIKPPTIIKNLDKYKDRCITNTNLSDIKVIENVTSPKIDGQEKFSDFRPITKSRSRITLKTKSRIGSARSQKTRPKIVKNAFVELSGSSDECSDEEQVQTNSKDASSDKTEGLVLKNNLLHKGSGETSPWPLRYSLFPNIPPYISFSMHDYQPNKLPCGRKYLKWKLSTITPVIVRKTLMNTGFRLVRKSNEWIGTWGKHMKSPMFKTLKSNQKLNHFAGTFQLGRKDRLWKNLQRLMHKYGKKEFGIIPETFVLPQDLKALKQSWECKDGSAGEKWIIKPPASARGVGIKVINKWSQLPKQSSLVVQRYISDPYLINGSKFDLRLYVMVTSFHPLRIYIYPEGLVRFASVKYSDNDKDLKDRYMHLTNYSINKLSSQYTANEDANSCQGHKWTLSKLWEFMDVKGINTALLWKNLKQLVIKTMISGESPITQLCLENVNSRYNCFELFGVDVLLDEKLKPWLLEVNISPSLHSSSPLDLHVKGPLVQTLFNLAQFHLPPKIGLLENAPECYEPKIYTTTLTTKEINKHNHFQQIQCREDYISEILSELTGDDIRHLTQAEDEYIVKGNFERIFPTSKTYKYLRFMPSRYYNRLFDAWENLYENNRKEGIYLLKSLCAQKLHLRAAPQSSLSKSSVNMNPLLSPEEVQQKITQQPQIQNGKKTDILSAQNLEDNQSVNNFF